MRNRSCCNVHRPEAGRLLRHRGHVSGYLVVACVCVVLAGGWISRADVAPSNSAWSDAAIRGLWFVDDQEGWAVGDDGLIVHTIDGGQTWERQASGTRAHLRQVHFLTPFIGYAVGEQALPETPLTAGVVLMTRDGGTTWRIVSDRQMPGLYHVRFFDEQRGVVAGDSCEGFPSGVWMTEDGGLTWRVVPHSRQPGWYAAAWVCPNWGIFAGRWGKLSVFDQRSWRPIASEWAASTAVRAVCWNGKSAWACGDGGLLLRCDDPQLQRWERVRLPVQEEWLRTWDFHACHFVGEFGWVAGRPGSVVLHTWDNGKSWQMQATPQSLPIYALYFVNERCGWAGGAGGTILHTDDGGKTWRIQRRGVHRAAALIVTARADSLPCELLANLAADQGFYTVAIRLLSEDAESEPEEAAPFGERFHAAVRQLGGICGETLSGWPVSSVMWLSSTEQLAQHLGRGDKAAALQRLQRQLVLTLRLWKPDVVITDHPDPRSATGAEGALATLVVTKAFRLAENADAFSEQITHFRLEPHAAAKLYACWDGPNGATLSADWNVVCPNLGHTLWEAAWPSRHLLSPIGTFRPQFRASLSQPRMQYFRLLDTRLPDAEKHRALMEGIHAPPGGPTRRAPIPIATDDAQMQWAARRARNLEEIYALAERMLTTPAAGERWLGELPQQIAQLTDSQKAEVYWQVSRQLQRQGQWGLAHQALVALLEAHPDSPLAPPATQWLAALLASSEARRRAELRQFACPITAPENPSNTTAPSAHSSKPIRKPASDEDTPTILQARRGEWRQWDRGALLAGDVLAAYGPLWWFDPRVQFCVLSAQRRLGRPEETLPAYSRFHTNWVRGPWYEAALVELAFLGSVRGSLPAGKPADANLPGRKHTALCTWANQPPYLDGQLDDPVWQGAVRLPLRNAVGQSSDAFPSEAWLAYDERFLYVALRCGHPPGHECDPVRPRRRDDDLRPYDRVSLLLDLDRDYVTCYHFQVDQRGCVYEECWGDPTWNPHWYVASRSTPTAWQAEIAIPWSELVRDPPTSRQVWAFNLVRIIPNHGVQAFSLPASVVPRPEGMALLTFAGRN